MWLETEYKKNWGVARKGETNTDIHNNNHDIKFNDRSLTKINAIGLVVLKCGKNKRK